MTFFGGKTCAVVIGFGASEIDFGVGGVEISTGDDGFLRFEKAKIIKKGGIPEIFAKRQTGEVGFAVGGIDVD